MIEYIKSYAVVLGLIVGLLPVAVSFVVGVFKFAQYVNVQKQKQKQIEYRNYHELIQRLTAPLPGNDTPWLDVQRAAAFELRNYPSYVDATEVILTGWIRRGTDMDGLMRSTLEKLGRPYNK